MTTRFWVVAGGILTQFTIIGLLFSFGLFFGIFEDAFGWSRTLMSACSSASFLMMGVLAMPAGRLSDRIGPRRVLATTGLAYGIGFALISQVSAPWQLFVIFVTLIGMGLSTHDVVTLSTVARWYNARRGLMTAVVKVGTASGQIAVPPATAALVALLGWRPALVLLGAFAAVVLLVAATMMRNPDVEPGKKSSGAEEGMSLTEARRTRTFWTLCVVQLLFFPTMMTVPLHLPVHAMDLGLSTAGAATFLSVIGAASIAGRLGTGTLSDRIGTRNAFAICLVILIGGLAGLAMVTSPQLLYGVVALYGLGHGGLFVIVSPTVASHFGMKAHGSLFGSVLFFGTLGGAIGPIAAGMVFDSLGSYVPAFLGLAALASLALVLVLSLPRPAAETA